MDVAPNFSQLSDRELKQMIKQLTAEEREVSYRRRLLHGRIDLLHSELVNRLKGRDEGELSVVDLDALSRILAGRLPDLDRLERDIDAENAEQSEDAEDGGPADAERG